MEMVELYRHCNRLAPIFGRKLLSQNICLLRGTIENRAYRTHRYTFTYFYYCNIIWSYLLFTYFYYGPFVIVLLGVAK